MIPIALKKKFLRLRFSRLRRRFFDDRMSYDVLLDYIHSLTPSLVCCYISVQDEFPTHSLIDMLLPIYSVVSPIICGRQLYFGPLTSPLWKKSLQRHPRYRVLEPSLQSAEPFLAEDTVLLIPGLGFDQDGGRLGYGGGFYDRILNQVPIKQRIGLAFPCQYVVNLPKESHDVPLGACFDGTQIHLF